MSLMKGVIQEIMKDVRGSAAERYKKPKVSGMIVEKKVIGPKESEGPKEESDEMKDLAELIANAKKESEGEEGKDWMHSESSESPEAEKIEKEAGLHKKPEWEEFEDEEPDWMKDPEILEKVLAARKEKYKK